MNIQSPKPESSVSPPSIPGPATGDASSVSPRTPRQISSAALLQGEREIQILHGEEVYRLSLTRQGKLILHK